MFYLRTDGAERYDLVLPEYEGSQYCLDVNVQVCCIDQNLSSSLSTFDSYH